MAQTSKLRTQIREVEARIRQWQGMGLLTSAMTFVILLILGFKNPFAYTFTVVPYLCATLVSIPAMIELNHLCNKLTGKH